MAKKYTANRLEKDMKKLQRSFYDVPSRDLPEGDEVQILLQILQYAHEKATSGLYDVDQEKISTLSEAVAGFFFFVVYDIGVARTPVIGLEEDAEQVKVALNNVLRTVLQHPAPERLGKRLLELSEAFVYRLVDDELQALVAAA